MVIKVSLLNFNFCFSRWVIKISAYLRLFGRLNEILVKSLWKLYRNVQRIERFNTVCNLIFRFIIFWIPIKIMPYTNFMKNKNSGVIFYWTSSSLSSKLFIPRITKILHFVSSLLFYLVIKMTIFLYKYLFFYSYALVSSFSTSLISSMILSM